MSYLGCYHFTADPAELLAAYDRLRASYPDSGLDLHVCVVRADGITVMDTCPDRATFVEFSSSPDFAAALAGVGLPAPAVEPLGEVYAAVSGGVRR
jgi:hypothetical protein